MQRTDLLFTREWCDLIFSGRNRSYGAYALRRGLGRRHRFGVLVVYVSVLLLTFVPVATDIFVRYTTAVKAIDEVKQLARLRDKEAEKDHELKAIAQGRQPVPKLNPGQTELAPVIAAELPSEKKFGTDGDVELQKAEGAFVDATKVDTALQNDTLAPIVGKELTPTEVVEQMPHFPGGPAALMKWLDANVVYPQDCISRRVEGDVRVSFIVNNEGNVSNPRVTMSSNHPELDRAALYAMRRMPKWNPGRVGGQTTNVRVTIPVHFQVE